MKTVLFVCTGNTCRSPMAAGFFRALDGESRTGLRAVSAGTFTSEGLPASKNAVLAARERGAELSDHRARMVTPEMVREAAHIVCMTEAHADRVRAAFPKAAPRVMTLADRDIQDPFGGNLACYRESARQIYEAVGALIDRWERDA